MLAKIEDQAAVESIDDIIKTADLVMVARGDLGIEVPMEELPIIQRRIVKSCIRLGKPVVVATHLLESMIKNRVPTRAEITDVANAVFEQADAIMLSGETSIGQYPVECVEVLNRVATRNERSGGAGYAESALLEDARQKTVASAVVLANSLARSRSLSSAIQEWRAHANLTGARHYFAFAERSAAAVVDLLGRLSSGRIQRRSNVTIETAQKYLRDQNLTTAGDNLCLSGDARARDALVDCVRRTVRRGGALCLDAAH
jgi:pyruvate kinase